MAEATYFAGVEFDWLRNQVAAVLWNPWKAATTEQQRLSDVVKKKKQQATPLPTYRERKDQDGVTRTWNSTAPQTTAMSVEDYNRWRGESPANAAHAPYVFQKYPTTLYKDGNRIKVGNAEDHDRLANEGWKESP